MPLSRRRFLRSISTATAVAVAAPHFWIRGRAAQPVRHASIGAGGQAYSDIESFAAHPAFDLVAVADVDLCHIEPLQKRFPKVRVYQNWRDLLKKEHKNLDSLSVSTPDHMHAAIALEIMRRRKPVYVQKPLACTLHEVRLMARYARQHDLVTQMGIQVSSSYSQRWGEAIVRSGIVGKIKEVHTISNKSWGDDKPLPDEVDPVPPTLDWDAWLGVAEARPFKRAVYHPAQWRRRVGFGTGTLGDMGCHIYSPVFRSLALTAPVSVTAYGPSPTAESWATSARVRLTYPGTEYTAGPTVDVWWYDGGQMPPVELVAQIGDRFPAQGSFFVGTDGIVVIPHMGADPFVLPKEKDALVAKPDLPERDHYREFIDAVLAGGATRCSANFDYSGPLTESVLIGNVAAHFTGETLAFDAKALRFSSKREANQYLTRSYRKGMEIKG